MANVLGRTGAGGSYAKAEIGLREIRLVECLYENIESSDHLARMVRKERGLSGSFSRVERFVQATTAEGEIGWAGPIFTSSDCHDTSLFLLFKQLGPRTSISGALEKLAPLFDKVPFACAIVDILLWDVVCRRHSSSFHSLITPSARSRAAVPFYASLIGLPTVSADLVGTAIDRYDLMKVSMMPDQIGNSLEILSIVSGAGSRVAFDAHGCFSLQDLLRIDERVLDVAWLEDPFSSNDKVWSTLNRQSTPLPRLAVGEDSHATKRLRELGSLSCVFALNLEVERLGISRALEILEIMRVIGKPCFLHGRLPVTSGHMALAYSDVVAQLEVHIPFAEERLISGRWLRPGVNDPRHLITSWMAEVGACISPACTIREIWRIDWRN